MVGRAPGALANDKLRSCFESKVYCLVFYVFSLAIADLS